MRCFVSNPLHQVQLQMQTCRDTSRHEAPATNLQPLHPTGPPHCQPFPLNASPPFWRAIDESYCAGQDPGARRAMWAYIEKATQGPGGRDVAVALTTHSMEECEALCSRVGIMHAGRLACIASPTRLKALYGQGYLLEVGAWIPSFKLST